jgi:hypothetical protein
MLDFLRAFCRNWLTLMSGVVGVVVWIVSAVISPFGVSIATHIGFLVAGGVAIFFASYQVWKNAVESGAARAASLQVAFDNMERRCAGLEARLNVPSPEKAALSADGKKLVARGKMLLEMLRGNDKICGDGRDGISPWHKAIHEFVKTRLPLEYVRFAADDDFRQLSPFGNYGQLCNNVNYWIEKLDALLV